MLWSTPEDLRGVMAPCEVVIKCFGMMPLFAGDSLKIWHKLINMLHLITTYAVLIKVIIVCMPFELSYASVSTVMNKSSVLLVVMYYLQPFCSTTCNQVLAGKMHQIVEKIDVADRKLKALGVQIDYCSQKKMVARLTAASIMGCVILFAMYASYLQDVDVPYALGASLFALYYSVLYIHAVNVSLLLFKRYRAMVEALRMYFPTTPTSSGFLSAHAETAVCSEKEQLVVLKQIKILHDKLNDVVELVNYCFSVQITFCVGLCFVIGVVCSFGLFRAFIYRNELFYMGVLNFIWYMYYLFFVLFFIAVGSKITREGKRIGVLVHKAINCSTSSAVINELNIFSQQLLHRSPVITCGLFVYDWTLLYTMIGATATYLIILIQFDVSFPNLVNVNGTTAVSQGV